MTVLPDDWRVWPDPYKRRLLERLQAEQTGAVAGSPGALAAHLTRGVELQAPHLEVIDQAFLDIEAGATRRIMITMPPRHGKTRRTSRWGPLWYLRRHPGRRVVVASYSGLLAEDHGRWIRDMIVESPSLGIQLHPRSGAANRFDLQSFKDRDGHKHEGGGLVTTGVGGTLTGRGADLLIVDDPIKDAQAADSPLMRYRLWEWWTSTALTRLEPGGAVIVIQTRWHENDLAGRLLANERDDWTVIGLPAVAYVDEEHPEGSDPLGRKPGDPLWPQRYDATELASIKTRVGERVWASLYQQRPRPLEGGVFQWSWIMENRIHPNRMPGIDLVRIVVAIDPAGGDGDGSDETGIVAAGMDEKKQSYVLADESGHMSAEAWGRQACLLALQLHADCFVVEANFGGDMTTAVIRNAWNQLASEGLTKGRTMPRIKAVHAKAGKRLRAEPIAQLYEQGRVSHVGEHPFLESQLTSWLPSMDSPDRMDANVHALTELNEGYAPPLTNVNGRDERLRGRR